MGARLVGAAVQILAVRGSCGIVGGSGELTLEALPLITGGRQIRGINEGDSVPELFIPKLLDLYSQGRFPFDQPVKFYDFAQVNEAIADSESGRVIKPIIRMSDG
jgi:aryl-alcohol dehydrogenase